MEKWTVILRSQEGLHFEVIEADAADWSDDERFLDFYKVEAVTEALQGVASLSQLRGKPPEEVRARLTEFMRSLGGIRIAQFDRESVVGYFMGLKANIDFTVGPRDD